MVASTSMVSATSEATRITKKGEAAPSALPPLHLMLNLILRFVLHISITK